jgi:hypothetical protein
MGNALTALASKCIVIRQWRLPRHDDPSIQRQLYVDESDTKMAKTFEEAGELSSADALRIIAKTLAIVAMRMGPEANATLENKAAFLVSCGFDTKTIAAMLESSVTTIAPLLSRRKAKAKTGTRRKAAR